MDKGWFAYFGLMMGLGSLSSFHYNVWIGLMATITLVCFIVYLFMNEDASLEKGGKK